MDLFHLYRSVPERDQVLGGHGKPLYVDQFGLYLDDQHVLKCKGRIGNSTLAATEKHPVLLPTKHPVVKLLVREVHCRVKHGGVNTTQAATREKYWILKGRQLIKGILRRCVVCKRTEGPPYCVQPLLIFQNLECHPLHILVKISQALCTFKNLRIQMSPLKIYICLFTCASTHAIHLELTRSLSHFC